MPPAPHGVGWVTEITYRWYSQVAFYDAVSRESLGPSITWQYIHSSWTHGPTLWKFNTIGKQATHFLSNSKQLKL